MGDKEKSEVQVSTSLLSPAPQYSGNVTPPPSDNDFAHRPRPILVKYLLIFIDLLLACSPLLFLGIAFAAIAFNGKPLNKENQALQYDPSVGKYVVSQTSGIEALWTTKGGNAVIAAAQIAVSIFPILFAAIVGKFLKSYAMHRAERGAPMGVLEQFYGSQSLSNAVQLTYGLSGPGLVGIGVVFLWLLSPLGGQATQRVLSTGSSFNSSEGDVYYTNTTSANGMWRDHFGVAMYIDNAYATLATAMLSDAVTVDNDIWGNVRIPYFEALDTDGEDPASLSNGSSYLTVPSGSTSSSMVGILINNVTNLTYTSFSIETSYLSLDCEPPRTWNYSAISDAVSNGTQPSQEDLQPYYDFLTWANLVDNLANGSESGSSSDSSSTNGSDYNDFWTTWAFNIGVQTNGSNNDTGYPIKTFANPPTFIYAAQESNVITAYKCPSRVTWVESDMQCNAGGVCGINGIRNTTRSNTGTIDPLFDQSSNDNGHGFPLQLMLGSLCAFSSSGATGIINPIQWYLTGSSSVFGHSDYPDYTKVSASTMAGRLGTLLNTFWMIGLQRAALSQPRSTNDTLMLQSVSNSTTYDPYGGLGYDVIGAYAYFSTVTDVYKVSWPFVVIAVIVSFMLLFLGFLGMYYRHTNTHPDVLGFVSTLTRDNPYFQGPVDANKLDGLEMANYYKSVRVQLVNTVVGEDRGQITLRPVQRNSGDI